MTAQPGHEHCAYDTKLDWRDTPRGEPEPIFIDMECEHGYSASSPFYATRPNETLAIVLSEMLAYGRGWRINWRDFDGRYLRDQLEDLAIWARRHVADPTSVGDYTAGTEFEEQQAQ